MSVQKRVSRVTRKTKGSSLLEVMSTTMAVLIPLVYLSVDVAAVVVGYSESVHVAKDAARAAASHPNVADAQQAANFRFKIVKPTTVVSNLTMSGFDFIPNTSVDVRTLVDVRLPAPFPEFSTVKLKAHALVPIISSAAQI